MIRFKTLQRYKDFLKITSQDDVFLIFFCTFAAATIISYRYDNPRRKVKLHIFNPEHDIALAVNVPRFTAPHAARQLRSDVGFLPALWADDGDVVLVDDVEAAVRRSRLYRQYTADVLYISPDDLVRLGGDIRDMEVQPWGWDQAIAELLHKAGMSRSCLSDEQLLDIRRLSSRKWAARQLLPPLRQKMTFPTVGGARYITRKDELTSFFGIGQPLVLKSPWSSSGRGIRYILDETHWERNLAWATRVIRQQGGIIAEPYYDKIRDFGMEFEALPDGTVVFRGLSLFMTKNGAYIGNIIATERAKREILSKFIPEEVLDKLAKTITSLTRKAFRNRYTGPFGIDMMIVREEDAGIAVHPCVELNLRRTMGHVALSLPCDETTPQRVMRLAYTDRYRLQITDTNENVINNGLA